MKVLIVDSDKRIRQLIKSVLTDMVDDFYECSDGLDAQEIYSRFLPDLVLMDLVMPNIDGITVIRQIKSLHPNAKIIILTSYKSAVIREQTQQAGGFAYVLKENLLDLLNLLTDK